MAAVEGRADAAGGLVDDVLAAPSLADLVAAGHADVLGPVPLDEATERLLIRVPRAAGPALARALSDVQRARRPRRNEPVVRVRLDPAEIG
jgi:primosomal protein N' (replication factor Y)